ncbi:hypothetical protein [Gemmata sp.]|uniref:hypothetical protein n=1 Tax=Gemmata sp. TaxID=1914242 RepID=UPI003F722B59
MYRVLAYGSVWSEGDTLLAAIGGVLDRLTFTELLALESLADKAQREKTRGDIVTELKGRTNDALTP